MNAALEKNVALAADGNNVTNERCSRINAAPYYNNEKYISRIITKNAVQLGNKTTSRQFQIYLSIKA